MNFYKDNTNISNTLIRDLQNCNKDTYLLGVLAEGRAFYPASQTNEVVSMISGGGFSVVFYLEPVSDMPVPIQEAYTNLLEGVMFMGLDNHQGTAIKPTGYHYMNEDEQIDYWREELKGKLIRFKPKVVIKKGKQPFLNLEIDGIEGDYDGQSYYTPIPVVTMDNETFEEKLKTGGYLQFNAYSHVFQSPEYVVCGDYIYTNFQHWTKNLNTTNMWKADLNPHKVRRIRLDDERLNFFEYVGGGNQDVIFINSNQLSHMKNVIHDFGKEIGSDSFKPDMAVTPTPVAELKVVPNVVPAVSKTVSTVKAYTSLDKSECGFLKNLQNATLKEGLVYRPTDLVNFHVSVKTSPLTIVAGMSGQGKTQLVRAYGKALGLTETNQNLLFLPITPSYLEPSDVLGYYNHSTNVYVPAETGLVDILIEAERNPEKLYMVIFDEMNLSQIEHWFAPFLSLLELNPEERRLALYSDQVACKNANKYKGSILLGENIKFVGTVNLDETTKELSDRLLDRVNVVTLQKTSFTMMKQETSDIKCLTNHFSANDFKAWVSTKASVDAYTEEELLFFDELHEIINSYDNQKGVSYRLVNRIGAYINNIPAISSEDEEEFELTKAQAIDLGVKQRLLTKIKGSERQIGGLIGARMSSSDIGEKGELTILLESEQAQAISSFEETLKEINRKALELGVYGFTN